jgi:putative addiction module killer protein
MVEVRQTPAFQKWFTGLKDEVARSRIAIRIRRLSLGNFGDAKSVGGRVFELRIDHGPGYRVYFTRRGTEIVILLAGGDKKSQERDIERARKLALEVD